MASESVEPAAPEMTQGEALVRMVKAAEAAQEAASRLEYFEQQRQLAAQEYDAQAYAERERVEAYREEQLRIQQAHLAERPTLRDQFAMAAMTGFAAYAETPEGFAALVPQAYEVADAMLAHRAAPARSASAPSTTSPEEG